MTPPDQHQQESDKRWKEFMDLHNRDVIPRADMGTAWNAQDDFYIPKLAALEAKLKEAEQVIKMVRECHLHKWKIWSCCCMQAMDRELEKFKQMKGE